uniref:Heat shock factor-binding protein 1-like n=1 Tax=Denticeps clupeoides TaxID=299321 RepID=A0AAY4BG08_9TELE
MSPQMETTMQTLQSKFQSKSSIATLTCTMDEMGTRIDDLEKDVADLMTQAGMEDYHQMAAQPPRYSTADRPGLFVI